jgi:hypothetical protein
VPQGRCTQLKPIPCYLFAERSQDTSYLTKLGTELDHDTFMNVRGGVDTLGTTDP